jgi:dTDP-4-dehydrorhamnose 3,5-epimerase-like enzyme
MKIHSITDLAIPEVKVIRFARFRDNRGYFSEHYRFSDFETGEAASFMNGVRFLQMNESFSNPAHVRGCIISGTRTWASSCARCAAA